MQTKIIKAEDLATVALPATSKTLRNSPRSPHLREEGYEEKFDYHTLFYDGFLMEGNTKIRFVGPVALNLAQHIQNGIVELLSAQSDAPVTVLSTMLTQGVKISRFDIMLSGPVSAAMLRLYFGELGIFDVQVNQNLNGYCHDQRVVMTLFKYEPIEWVRDWLEYNVIYHGATGAVIAHNTSIFYSDEELMAGLSTVKGLETLVILHWPFKYGPHGNGYWDSTFCQVGLFDQLRWRLLADAKSVLNSDVDELIVSNEHQSVFEMTENSPLGFLKFSGVWVSGENGRLCDNLADTRRHRNFITKGGHPRGWKFGVKWAIVPARCPEANQWLVHNVQKMDSSIMPFATLGARHFRDINTGWKREKKDDLTDPEIDRNLSDAFKKVGWQ